MANQARIVDVAAYMASRGKFAIPNADEAAKFMVTEVAEVIDVIMRKDPKFTRNNANASGWNYIDELGKELADVVYMAFLCANAEGIDLAAYLNSQIVRRSQKHLGNDGAMVAGSLLEADTVRIAEDKSFISYLLTQPRWMNPADEDALRLKGIMQRFLSYALKDPADATASDEC
jgi:NTP pyrophosphatase (non-canonical NTP hydrolase)